MKNQYLLSSAVSMVNLYWLRVLEMEGLLTLSFPGMLGFDVSIAFFLVKTMLEFLQVVLVSFAWTVLVEGPADKDPAGGRLVTVGLDNCVGLSNTDLALVCAGFCVACLERPATDVDRTFVTFWTCALVVSVLGSALPTVALAFQIAPIFDWTTLPLYMPGTGFDVPVASGLATVSSIIFPSFTACSPRKTCLCVCRFSVAAAPCPSLLKVLTLFRVAADIDFESTPLALRTPVFGAVSSLLLFLSWKGAAGILSRLIKDLISNAGRSFSLFPWNKEKGIVWLNLVN